MDFNYLYHRHGVAMLMAGESACDASRTVHLALAAGYAARIADLQRAAQDAAAR